MESEHPLKDLKSFFQGNLRYQLYYSQDKFPHSLMRPHIRKQIQLRIHNMNPQCFKEGQCIHCGCETTALQMATRPCEGLEYPPLIPSKQSWVNFLHGNYTARALIDSEEYAWSFNPQTKNLSLFKKRPEGKYYDLITRTHFETSLE